jgi:hypothetical protein
MIHNDKTPDIEVDAKTYSARRRGAIDVRPSRSAADGAAVFYSRINLTTTSAVHEQD